MIKFCFFFFVIGFYRYDSVWFLLYVDVDFIMICFLVVELDSMDYVIFRVSDVINDVIFIFNEIKKKKSCILSFMCVWNFFYLILEKNLMSFEFVCEIILGFFFFLVVKWS